MVFSNPSYLWALLGLLVPLAIHLWSKKEAKTVKIGSVQLLEESNSRQSSSIQLNEWLLLLLRMLIVSLVVFVMAGPQWSSNHTKQQLAYVVEPSLLERTEVKKVMDSLALDFPVYVLQPGFSAWEGDADAINTSETPDYWQLVQQMDSLPSDSLVIFTKTSVQGFKSKRPSTQKKLHWVVMASDSVQNTPIGAIEHADGIQLITQLGNSEQTYFKKEALTDAEMVQQANDSLQGTRNGENFRVPLMKSDTIKIQIVADEGFENDKKFIEASFSAISGYLKQPISIKDNNGDSNQNVPDLGIWLSESICDKDGRWLVFQPDSFASQLIAPDPIANHYYLTARLNTQNTLDGHLTEQLLDLLDLDSEWKSIVSKHDMRQLAVDELRPKYVQATSKKERASFTDVTPWLLVCLAVLMIVERLMAYVKKQ
ncbi:BatA domain-containing protein [Flagellimonas beolgyonensis]|uniref:BatA domain-containing protein n=1 Tax=Flagellimonas beolgyonensis TaxID=864064 RepID=UPI000F8D7676|nr:BatA domain-containing protein [Allomuricauda beolgyonensis]